MQRGVSSDRSLLGPCLLYIVLDCKIYIAVHNAPCGAAINILPFVLSLSRFYYIRANEIETKEIVRAKLHRHVYVMPARWGKNLAQQPPYCMYDRNMHKRISLYGTLALPFSTFFFCSSRAA